MMRSSVSWVLLAAVVVAVASLAAPAPGGSAAPATPIDGRWHTAVTRADLLRTGDVDQRLADELYGPSTVQFQNGRFVVRNERTGRGAHGTFSVVRNVVRFVFAAGVGLRPGQVAFCAWSLYRDRLTFAEVPGRHCMAWNAGVWTRAS